jgi:3-oxoisoapionate decarboxylase
MLEGLRIARAVGARAMRCVLGSSPDRTGPLPIDAHMENTINAFQSVRSEALDLGVKIAIENHDGEPRWRHAGARSENRHRRVGKDYVGSNLDTGNPLWVVEDPFVALETLAPYVVTTHIRDSVLFEHPRGAAGQWVALGDGTVDFVRFMVRFRELCPKSSMQLELITGRPPRIIPYWSRTSGKRSRKLRQRNLRASWRWPRPGIRVWARWWLRTSPEPSLRS